MGSLAARNVARDSMVVCYPFHLATTQNVNSSSHLLWQSVVSVEYRAGSVAVSMTDDPHAGTFDAVPK